MQSHTRTWILRLAAAGAVVPAVLVIDAGLAGAANDYAGQTYADATAALDEAGLTGVVATREGDALPLDDCAVISSEQAPWIKGDDFARVTDTVLLNLNCNAAVASAVTPGNSAASPEGREAIAQAKAAAEQEQATAVADQAKPER